ncbi:hypothetical protein EV138_2176 [Kribbella voronezhensis]|uniref:Integral membrane protein n=1 Tax=Kribbella voronezhensis TaxID=2512212 RepID=A0A4R7T9G9_9ACTN|nr:hypothetical protein [Kribbella voronezhensis]TDU88630.1 hypothetical protein EV138_2176 [Kribbella voronezhensis]
MRLTVGGVLVYAGMALLLVVQTVRLVTMDRLWVDGVSVAPAGLVVVAAAAALLFLTAVVTRQPLVEGDGPWFITMGWLLLIALTALSFVISLSSSLTSEEAVWVTGPAVFVPFWVRKLEESYREGVEEAQRDH